MTRQHNSWGDGCGGSVTKTPATGLILHETMGQFHNTAIMCLALLFTMASWFRVGPGRFR